MSGKNPFLELRCKNLKIVVFKVEFLHVIRNPCQIVGQLHIQNELSYGVRFFVCGLASIQVINLFNNSKWVWVRHAQSDAKQ